MHSPSLHLSNVQSFPSSQSQMKCLSSAGLSSNCCCCCCCCCCIVTVPSIGSQTSFVLSTEEGKCEQVPVSREHESMVHAFPSSQEIFECMHPIEPSHQSRVHPSPSSHALCTWTHSPVAFSHESTVHGSESEQSRLPTKMQSPPSTLRE